MTGKFRFGMYAIILAVLLSALTLGIFNTLFWSDGSTTLLIEETDTAYVDISVNSFNAGAAYSIDLYNSSNVLIKNLQSGTVPPDGIGGGFYSTQLPVTYADRGSVAGVFYIVITSSEGGGSDVDMITLNALGFAPVVTDIPNVALEAGIGKEVFELDDYVSDADNLDSEQTWTVRGLDNVTVSIDTANDNAVTIVPNAGFLGTDVILFTVTDPDGYSASDSVTVTVGPAAAVEDDDKSNELSIDNVKLRFYGLDMIKIRNTGNRIKDVILKINIEAPDVETQIFRFDLDRNRVIYKQLDLGDLEKGTYLARIEIRSDEEGLRESKYMLIETL